MSGTALPCGRQAIFLAVSFRFSRVRSVLSAVRLSHSRGIMPMIALSSVLFPEPFAPMTDVSFPFGKDRLMPEITGLFL